MTPLSAFEVPDVLKVHEVPSEEVRMVPEPPTATKVLFPKVTRMRLLDVAEDALSKDDPMSQITPSTCGDTPVS